MTSQDLQDDAPSPAEAGRAENVADRPGPAEACGNCGAPLHGPFCAQCGQQRRGLDMPVATFVASAFAGLASFDGRFWRTVLPLIGRPGFLTRELIEGRRVRYVPPMRLYLFVSFVFFLTVQLTGQEIVVNNSGSSGGGVVTINTSGALEPAEAGETGADGEAVQEQPATAAATSDAEADGSEGPTREDTAGQEADTGNTEDTEAAPTPDATQAEPEANETDPSEDAGGFGNMIKDAIFNLAEDPERGTDVLLRRLPIMVFLLVPLAALWLRLLFRGRQSYYVPNLVASLHLHSAVLLLLNISLLTEYLPGPDLVGGLIVLWIPIYTLLTLMRVYRAGWWGSFWRMGVFGFVHMIALTFGLLVSVIITGLSL